MRHRRPPDCDRPVADRRPPFARSPASEAAHTGALRSAGSRHARYGRVRLVVPPANEAAPAAVRPFDRWATGQTGRLRSVAGERRPSLGLRTKRRTLHAPRGTTSPPTDGLPAGATPLAASGRRRRCTKCTMRRPEVALARSETFSVNRGSPRRRTGTFTVGPVSPRYLADPLLWGG